MPRCSSHVAWCAGREFGLGRVSVHPLLLVPLLYGLVARGAHDQDHEDDEDFFGQYSGSTPQKQTSFGQSGSGGTAGASGSTAAPKKKDDDWDDWKDF